MNHAHIIKTLAGCLILALLFIGTAAAAEEIPPLPAQYYGTVAIDKTPAPVGTVITAKIGDTVIGTLTLTEAGKLGSSGTFGEKLLAGPASQDVEGKTITFWIGDVAATETTTFKAGDAAEITLTFSGAIVSPQPSASVAPSQTTGTTAPASSSGGSTSDSSSASQGSAALPEQTGISAPVETSDKQGTTNPESPPSSGNTPVVTVGTTNIPTETATKETPSAPQTTQAPVPLLGIFAGFAAALYLRNRTRSVTES